MAEKTTGNLSPEEVSAQETEQKNQNQAEAFKRLQEDKDKLQKEKLDLEEKVKQNAKTPEELEKEKLAKPEKADLETLKKEVKEELKADQERESKVSEVLTKYPQLQEHKETIEKFLSDESRQNIPADEVVAGAIGIDALLKAGADMGAEAITAATNSKTGAGNSEQHVQTEQEKTEQRHLDSLPDEFKS